MLKRTTLLTTITFICLFLAMSIPLHGQSKRKKAAAFNFEYTPTLCSAIFENEDPALRWTHSFFAKGLFYLNKNLRMTLGLGYMNTRYHTTQYIGSVHKLNEVTTTRFYNYLVLPAGFKFNIGPIFINPELGMALNIGYHKWLSGYSQDQMKIKERSEDAKPSSTNNVVVPAFMTIGHEIKQKRYSILLGIKSNISVTSFGRGTHFYGFGFMVGIKL